MDLTGFRLQSLGLWLFRMAVGLVLMGWAIALSVWAIASGKPADNPGLRLAVLLVTVPIAVVCSLVVLWAIITIVRNPRLISSTVVVTRQELLLPLRRRGRIPLDEVAGVGLDLQSRSRFTRGGMWRFVVWRSDGSREWFAGDQRKGESETPERTRAGVCAVGVYDFVLAHQGPDGNLSRRALQHHNLPAMTGFTRVWDPATAPSH